jgi:aminoglycoside/choline kinase family phosphotransferase
VTKPTLITDPEEVTSDWFTDVLRHVGYDARVISYTARQVGTGQMSRSYLYSLEVEGDDEAPRSMVGKFNSGDPATRSVAKEVGSYRNEVGFYRDFARQLPVSTPRCYFADIAPDEIGFVLLLEDMSPARQGDQMDGVSLPVARQAVGELAKLHASTWNDPSLGQRDWLSSLARDQAEVYESQRSVTSGFLARFAGRIGQDVVSVVEWMADGCQNLIDGLAEQPAVLIHWDYRADNILIDARCEPPAVIVVDWQTLTVGPPAQDLAYFLGASLVPELRRAHERSLVAEYYDAVLRLGVTGYTRDRCWRGYQLGSFSGLTMAVRAAMLVEETERGNEMFATMARRHGQQILDIGADALL